MAAPKTVITFDLDGSNKDFEVPFEYLARKFVVVTLIGTDRRVLTLSTEYRFTQRTIITTTQSWGPADGYERIEIRRLTSATERLVDFSDGSVLRAYDLNISNVQSLHIAEEGRDIATDTIGVDNDGNLDARGRKVVNLADGVEPGDAVTVRQQLANAESAMASAVVAVNAKNASEAARGQSQAAATTSGEKAVLSATEAEKSRVQAVIATEAVASIGTSVGDAAASASAANDYKLAAKVSEDNSKTSETNSKASELAAKAAEVTSRSAGVQLGMTMWGHRPQPFQGFALDDGQELDKSLYPDFVAALTSGLFPTVTEAVWQADPSKRACFVLTSSAGKFRMRDLNGVQPGSLGANFLRGGSDATPAIKRDQMQVITGSFDVGDSVGTLRVTGAVTGAFKRGAARTGVAGATTAAANAVEFDSSLSARTGSETFPTHATGAWMTRLYGLITPLGSAEASSLATAYASLASRVSVLEARPQIKAKGNFTVTGGVLTARDLYGCTVVRVSVGLYEITFTTPQPTSGYAVGMSWDSIPGINDFTAAGAARQPYIPRDTKTASRFRVIAGANANTPGLREDMQEYSFIVF